MDAILIWAVCGANAGFFYFVYIFLNRFCKEEEEERRKYKEMSDLEIRLLNNKIEELNERSSGA